MISSGQIEGIQASQRRPADSEEVQSGTIELDCISDQLSDGDETGSTPRDIQKLSEEAENAQDGSAVVVISDVSDIFFYTSKHFMNRMYPNAILQLNAHNSELSVNDRII